MSRSSDINRHHISVIMGLLRGQQLISVPPSLKGFWELDDGLLVPACDSETLALLIDKEMVITWSEGVHHHYSFSIPLPWWHDNCRVSERPRACILAIA